MSVRKSWTTWCDHCEAVIGSSDLGSETAAEDRRVARHNGAHTGLPGGRDVCADCWGEGKR